MVDIILFANVVTALLESIDAQSLDLRISLILLTIVRFVCVYIVNCNYGICALQYQGASY